MVDWKSTLNNAYNKARQLPTIPQVSEEINKKLESQKSKFDKSQGVVKNVANLSKNAALDLAQQANSMVPVIYDPVGNVVHNIKNIPQTVQGIKEGYNYYKNNPDRIVPDLGQAAYQYPATTAMLATGVVGGAKGAAGAGKNVAKIKPVNQVEIAQKIKPNTIPSSTPKTTPNIKSIQNGKTRDQIVNANKPKYENTSINEFLKDEPEIKPNWTSEEIAQANQNTKDFFRGTYTPDELNAAEVPYIIDSISKNTGLSPQEALNYLRQNTKLIDKSIDTVGHFNPVFQPEVGIDPTPNLPSSFTLTNKNVTPMDTWRHEVGGHLATHSAQYPAMYNRNLDFNNLIKNEFNNEVLRQTQGGREWLNNYGKNYVNESLPYAMESLGYEKYQVPNETIINHYKNVGYNADLNSQDVLNLRREIENRVSDYYTDAMLRNVDTSYYNQIPNYFKGLGIDYNLPNY